MDEDQVRSIEEHLEAALSLGAEEVEKLQTLAEQLKGKEVLPILGAGASHDCGMRVASKIAIDLHTDCANDEALAAHLDGVPDTDLGQVAEAIYTYNGNSHQAVLEAIGMPDITRWPGTPEVDRHFCALRILARAVREHPYLKQAFSFNYDCCGEAALRAEGFSLSRERTTGRFWLDHADFICSKDAYQNPEGRDGFKLVKAHGCAEHYREAYEQNSCDEVAEAIVIRAEQIATWEERHWARRALSDRVQNHILLLIGFSGQDRATAAELKSVLEDVHAGGSESGRPRLVVIDQEPDTDALRALIDFGVGPDGAEDGAVTEICTAGSSTTAVLLVLLAEMISLELRDSMQQLDFTLPPDLDAQLGLLTLTGPAMARWSFLLGGSGGAYMQRINAGIDESDYVPLCHEPQVAVRAFKIRKEMREAMGLSDPEKASDLCTADGFVVHDGRAYLPLGIDLKQVLAAHGGGALAQAKAVLPWPKRLTSILVCEEGGARSGVSVETGDEVPVP